MERAFGGGRIGCMLGGSLVSSVAGAVIGTAIAQQFFRGFGDAVPGGAGSSTERESSGTKYTPGSALNIMSYFTTSYELFICIYNTQTEGNMNRHDRSVPYLCRSRAEPKNS